LRLTGVRFLAAVTMAAALGACFSERRPPTALDDLECSVALPTPGSNQVLVAIRDFAFHPAELRFPAGTTVTWINCEPAAVEAHTSTADGGAWSSPSLQPVGGTFSHTFVSPGRFDYHCAPHPFMRGTVVVEG
jgi:plastocyanin